MPSDRLSLHEWDRQQNFIAAALQDRDAALWFIGSEGYRRCDIPACNCNSWHGGNASTRLTEIRDALGHERTNAKTILAAVEALIAEVTPEEPAWICPRCGDELGLIEEGMGVPTSPCCGIEAKESSDG